MQTEMVKNEESIQADNNNTYDEVPYESFPYDYTHPENLCVIGRLFKIKAKSPENSRILEIGCASGGNILPIALRYPKSECVGIDLSIKQIDEGNKIIDDLDLKNITLKHIGIEAVDSDIGEFDYIICHGVLSWVTENIHDMIFKGCKQLLAKDGLAMISYNTLPGWNAVNSVRDMMLYHSEGFTNPNEKLSQCRAFLEFILGNFKEKTDDPYYRVIKKELEIMDNTTASYFFHDHLESENNPMYFHQFCTKAEHAGFAYVSNTDIRSMYTGNYKQEVGKFLAPVVNDICRTEQYLDFISNRRFRSSIICHAGVEINRNIDAGDFAKFCVSTDLRPKVALTNDLIESSEMVQFTNGSTTLTVGTKLDKAIVKVMSERHYKPVSISKLAVKVQQMIGENSLEQVISAVSATCLNLLLSGAFTVHLEEGYYVTEVSDKPRASSYAQYQSGNQDWVTNLRSRKLKLGPVEKVLIQYLNGKRDLESLVIKTLKHVENGDLSVKNDTVEITDKTVIKEKIKKAVSNSLQVLAQNSLLVS